MGISEILKSKRSEILRLATQHGARNVRLFGSVARGEAGPESDVDLLIDFEANRRLLDHVALMQDRGGSLREKSGCGQREGPSLVHSGPSLEGSRSLVKDDQLYLIHILECIERIESYTQGGREAFQKSKMSQDAVIRNFEVMGEAAKNVSDATRQIYPAFRDVLIHDYLGVDLGEVWNIVEQHLPPLKRSIKEILKPGRKI